MAGTESNQPESGMDGAFTASTTRRSPTSTDVARRAGVSQATVSYVLNNVRDSRVSEETRARVIGAAEELGYTPHAIARSLRAGYSNVILLPRHTLPTGPNLTLLYEGLAARLSKLGYTSVAHLDPSVHGLEAARIWASLRPAGLLIQAERVTHQSIKLLQIAGTQAIILIDETPSPFAPTVLANDSDIAACAAEHLISRGYRHVAAIVPCETELLRLGVGRLNGVERVGHSYGLPVERIDLAFDEAAAAQLVARWKHMPHPTGVFTYNDEYGMLLMRALLDAGFAIPDDIALVGADNLPFCTLLRPRLTSVDPGLLPGIDSLAETFDELIQGKQSAAPLIQLLHPTVVQRESA